MKDDYFVKYEEIRKRGNAMIIMDVKADNLYAFKNFHMNMSYPKRIVDSSVEGEFLKDRRNFRYKKINIIMGGNATGKTSFGKMLMLFANYIRDGVNTQFLKVVDEKDKPAVLTVDFVAEGYVLYRFAMNILPCDKKEEPEVHTQILHTQIGGKDSYESCAKRLDRTDAPVANREEINTLGWFFSYPQDAWKNKTYYSIENDEKYLFILEQVLKTLDPSIQEVIRWKELENTYAIKLKNQSVVIKDGKINDTEILSSGTKAGLDISYIIASLVCNKHSLYYCDELFSFVNSDVEKACLSVIIAKLTEDKQLFFTTHNTEILDMQLPKHSFTFLKKDMSDPEMPIHCVYAGDYLKRNTDSLKHAAENDLFGISPELERLYDIENL